MQLSRAGCVHGLIVATDTAALTNEFASLPEQDLRKLVNEAIKHDGRPDERVEVSRTENGEFIQFAASNDGPGIDKQYHELLFKMSESLEMRDEIAGSGMGRPVAEKTMGSYGGRIVQESSFKSGATFRLMWPKQIQLIEE